MSNDPATRSSQVWWSYLGQTYPSCREGGFVGAPGQPDHPVQFLQPGDLVVHEYRRKIVAVSRVAAPPELQSSDLDRPTPTNSVWRVPVTFTDLRTPVPFEEIRDQLLAVEPDDGPMHAPFGSGTPGDLYPFNHAALQIVLRATETEL